MNLISSGLFVLSIVSFCYLSTFSKTRQETIALSIIFLSFLVGLVLKLMNVSYSEIITGLLSLVGLAIFAEGFVSRVSIKSVTPVQYLALAILIVYPLLNIYFSI